MRSIWQATFLLLSLFLPVLASAQPAITDVSPNSAARGATVGVQITGSETIFQQDSEVTSVVWLQQNGSRIDATTVDVTSATLLDATFEIPGNAPVGLWDVNVEQVGGAVVTLLDGFTILSGCGISDLAAGTQTGCVPASNTYTQQVIVTFANPPSTGNLVVNGQNFTIGTSPQTVTLTGLTANGNAVNVTANFSAEVGCSRTENSLFTAPPSCAVQPCSITDLAAGTQTGCVPATNTYTQQVVVTFANAPATGNLVVNGQNFTIGTSPQTVTLTGLVANGAAVNVTAAFSANTGCSRTENSLFTAPASCAPVCGISDLAAGTQTACVPATNTYTQQVIVTFANAPATGNLVVNGQNFTIGTSPQTVTLTGLVANGAAVNVTASFSANTTCSRTENALFTAPANCEVQPCSISDLAAGTQTGCVPATNTYTQQVIVTFANAPATGNLVVNGQTFTIGTSPQTVTLTGLNANGAAVNVTANFSANTGCSRTENALFTAPASCAPVCGISDLAAGTQTPCVPATNTYTQEVIVTFANAPATGNLVVNGQTFTIGTSPQTVTLTGLNANGAAVNVTANFSANTSCSRTENALFTAPASCAPVCGISDLATGTQTGCVPATNTYTQEVIVTFANPPATGNLVVNGQSFTIGTSPQTVTLTGLVANGAAVNVTASFSANTSCSRTENGLFTAPVSCTPVCSISDLAAGTQTPCDPANNTYTQQVVVTFTNPPATGNLVVNGQSFAIGVSPQTVTLTGLVSNGAAVDVTASFSANTSCSRTENALFTAPARCRQGDAPDCSEAEPSIAKLWPPNHKFQKVSIRGVTDPDGGDVTITITGVTSDEPVNGSDDGNTCPDAKIKSNGRVELRAERTGNGNGRVYAIHFTATDETDDSCDGVVFVCVPPNKDSVSCVRDETQYDVTRCTAAKAGEESPGLPLVARAEGDQIAILITTEESGPVDLALFDLRGRLVRRLAARDFPAGEHTLHWDGRDTNGREVANGLYFVRVVMSGETHTSKTVWMR